MLNGTYVEQSQFEHRFWLQILGDHSRFIYFNLSPKETELIYKAGEFIKTFDRLLERARTDMAAASWQAFAAEVRPAVQSLRSFKLEILKRHLLKKVLIGLPPTFFNHMLNELEEYLKNLACLVEGRAIPARSPVHHHLLWVLDAVGHARTLYCNLDSSQTKLLLKANAYMELWSKKYLESIEYAGFLRTGQAMFPSLGQFDKDVAEEMTGFKEYLELLKEKALEARAIGTINALVPDHMAREECYFLYRLSRSDPDNVNAPKCDPTKPRIT